MRRARNRVHHHPPTTSANTSPVSGRVLVFLLLDVIQGCPRGPQLVSCCHVCGFRNGHGSRGTEPGNLPSAMPLCALGLRAQPRGGRSSFFPSHPNSSAFITFFSQFNDRPLSRGLAEPGATQTRETKKYTGFSPGARYEEPTLCFTGERQTDRGLKCFARPGAL